MTRLPDAAWRDRPGLRRIVAALADDGGAVKVVGGAVRDTLLGLDVTDVDLATPLVPGEVTRRLEAAGIKVIPTGIAHGTVTAIASGDHHEITTLRRDVATDGRRATVAFADDWREDAARRDFTINALYADPRTGAIDDWFGGLADLDRGRVAFIGDAASRIAEDHLRILRFYRFAARFGRGDLDPASHAAVVAARQSLKSLSRERIADELAKILALPDPRAIVAQMHADGILAVLLPELDAGFAAALDRLFANEAVAGAVPAALRRLAALLPADVAIAEQVASRLRLSTRQRKHLAALGGHRHDVARPVRQLAYAIGIEAARDVHLLAGDPAALRTLSDWQVPMLPVKGGDIVARGIAAGPEVARILKAVEAAWVAEDFPDAARVAELVDQKIGRVSD
ncbi:CCA tRNA nucleotidyltransferase [Sphingopyxis alaskensis]|uniref:Polynucleotide adenylyltransferase region n=1 Tax=Sphingopyxis alaskensis (strain DSM 13593 / LMG 18877 / RB2256) TaxID=317655 RepID=Q1GRA3_SPHAL|nr:CCA tRNA nucleotidyltransferase [Sphingopyxis alaskensis]ABF53819.1 Polynucleotide adenylyltransferase region [Sphingopyxis alaskensis RB2256]MCM3419500.1 CCA tRNA nucleotidyltransferase [Sphingopyxis alaskensis]